MSVPRCPVRLRDCRTASGEGMTPVGVVPILLSTQCIPLVHFGREREEEGRKGGVNVEERKFNAILNELIESLHG